MAEVFGTVAGALSIAALFNNCVDCFEYIQLSRHFGRDFERCQLKLDIAKLRLSRWGEAVEVNDDPRFSTDAPEDRNSRHAQAILEEVEQLFQTVWKSSKRYQIDAKEDDLATCDDDDMQHAVQRLHSRLGVIARQRHKRTSLLKKTVWALYDGKNFDKLIKQITGFVDDLEKLFPMEATRRRLVELEIEEMNDTQSLSALENAAASTDDLLARAVVKKIEGIAGRNYANDIKSEETARVLVGNAWTEAAMSRASCTDHTVNTAGSVLAKGKSVVQIGNQYGGAEHLLGHGV